MNEPSLIRDLIIYFMPGLLAALVGAIVAHRISSRRSRIMLTNELFKSYHSPALITAREEAWSFLGRINQSSDTPSFSELWKDENKQAMRGYRFLVQIVAFWFQLCMSKKQKTIDDSLARKLFAYQFKHWRRQLMPLYIATEKKDSKEDRPDWLTFMEAGEMDWLTR